MVSLGGGELSAGRAVLGARPATLRCPLPSSPPWALPPEMRAMALGGPMSLSHPARPQDRGRRLWQLMKGSAGERSAEATGHPRTSSLRGHPSPFLLGPSPVAQTQRQDTGRQAGPRREQRKRLCPAHGPATWGQGSAPLLPAASYLASYFPSGASISPSAKWGDDGILLLGTM